MAQSKIPLIRKNQRFSHFPALSKRTATINRSDSLSYNPCQFKRYKCPIPCLDGYVFCSKHILEDKNAPFKQCSYMYPQTRERCTVPAQRISSHGDAETYCSEHLHLIQKSQNRGKIQPPLSAELLLSQMGHLVKPKSKPQGEEAEETKDCVNPFVDCNALAINESQNRVLDYCSDSDSDVDVTTLNQTAFPKDEDSSEAESLDEDDCLKTASVLTTEEAILCYCNKLSKLQSLYTEQFKWLKHELRKSRKAYLMALQEERESMSSIANQPRDTVKEQKLYQKLCSLSRYHRHRGVEALLRKKRAEKRTATLGNPIIKLSALNKCVFTEGGVKCCAKTIPSTKYCLRHILEDNNQLLFRPCGKEQDDTQCHEPVPILLNQQHCTYHTPPPPMVIHYNSGTSSSEDEEDVKEETPSDMFPVIKAILEAPKRNAKKANFPESLITNETTAPPTEEIAVNIDVVTTQ